MRIDIVSIFPEMFSGPLDTSIVKRARDGGLVDINLVDIRDYTLDRHRRVDDYPFGGGAGMVMSPEPLARALEGLQRGEKERVILMTPQGKLFNQKLAHELSALERLVLVCGHYEGIDERVRSLVDDELSVGDFVLTGGEIPAMLVTDAVVRLLPGVLGASQSLEEETFSEGLLEYPQYTRPREFRDMKVPDVLLSGNHAAINRWRRKHSLGRTWERRPDLIQCKELKGEDLVLLKEYLQEKNQTFK